MSSTRNYHDALYNALCPRWLNDAEEVSLSTSSARSGTLSPGYYFVKCNVDTHVKQGIAGSVSAATDDWIFEAGAVYPMVVTVAGTDDAIAGILDSGTGTMQIILVV